MVYILVLRCLHERVMRQCYTVERQCCVVKRLCYAITRQCCVVVQQCMAVLWCCAVVSTEKARQVQSTADVMLLHPLHPRKRSQQLDVWQQPGQPLYGVWQLFVPSGSRPRRLWHS